MNYFSFETAAKRYAMGRPFFHPVVRDQIAGRLTAARRPRRGLDVACGTGLSTRILADLADEVVGCDLSAEMLAEAWQSPKVSYVVAGAEELPFPAASFDLATVALAFHWFDRQRFLQEIARVLRPGGLLVIYNHWFPGEMDCSPGFGRWYREEYLRRYPPPKRDARPLTAAEASAAGLSLVDEAQFQNRWPFTTDELANYLLTQSNVIAAVECGRETADDAYQWIVRTSRPAFQFGHESFLFAGSITFLRSMKLDE